MLSLHTFEALRSRLVAEHVNPAFVNDVTIVYLRKVGAHGSGASRHIPGPGSVAHAEEDRLTGPHVSGLALVPDNGAVAPAASIQDCDVRVRDVRESDAL